MPRAPVLSLDEPREKFMQVDLLTLVVILLRAAPLTQP